MNRLTSILISLVLAALAVAPARADLRVDGTRVIYIAGENAPSVRIRNQGDRPSLIQTWVSDGRSKERLEEQRQPFVATPPMFRLDPGKRRDVSVRPSGVKGLPTDRESMFWLNILDVMGSKAEDNKRPLEVAVHWQLKLFHRPSGLPGNAAQAPHAVTWRRQVSPDGKHALHAHNPSPYHVSLAGIAVNGQSEALDPASSTILPFGEWQMPLEHQAPGTAELEFRWVDDKGKQHVVKRTVAPAGS